jgi:glycosyltransferase involved in cell wall biosynthesis
MKPRILMIISLFYPALGGAEQQARLLAEQLIKRGYTVIVLTRRFKHLPGFETIEGIPTYRSIRHLPWKHWFGLTYMFSVFWFLLKHRNSYDIIHCHESDRFHTIVAAMTKKLLKKKAIAVVTSSGAGSDFARLKKRTFGHYFLRKLHYLDKLITLCTISTTEAINEGFNEGMIKVIPNGVDTLQLKPLAKKSSKTTLIYVGRLVKTKGVHILLDAFHQILKNGISASLIIAGDGPEREKLVSLTHRLGISSNTHFHGSVKNVAPLLQKSDVFVLPSSVEGLPNALLEAMSCGLAVVATRVGGNTEIIEDGINGLLIDPEDSQLLSITLMKILKEKETIEKLGRNARKTIEDGFSIDYITTEHEKFYKELSVKN